jgi:hypothetical protein
MALTSFEHAVRRLMHSGMEGIFVAHARHCLRTKNGRFENSRGRNWTDLI